MSIFPELLYYYELVWTDLQMLDVHTYDQTVGQPESKTVTFVLF